MLCELHLNKAEKNLNTQKWSIVGRTRSTEKETGMCLLSKTEPLRKEW